MDDHRLPHKLSVCTLLILQTFFTAPAFAAGYQLYEQSPSIEGSALAGAAATNNDVTALFYNPATLSTLKENQAYLGAFEIIPRISMSDGEAIHTVNIPGIPASSISAHVVGDNHQNNISQGVLVPDLYASWRFNDKWTAGIATVAPFGLATNYYANSVLRFVARYNMVKTIDFVPSLSYTLNPQWSFGVGFQAQYMKATLSNYDGPYTSIPAIDAIIAANNPTRLNADGWGYGYTLGVLFKPDLCTRLGLGFRSQISQQLNGSGRQYTLPGITVPAPSPDFLFNAKTSVHADIRTPAVLMLSAERDIDNWTVKGTAQVNFWNTFKRLSVDMPDAFATRISLPTKWQNAWFASLGADYRLSSAWTVRAGIAYDETPTTKYRDARIPDTDRYWASIGTSYIYNKCVSFDAAYTHIFMVNQTVNITQPIGTNAISSTALEVNEISATYRGYADILAVGVRVNF